jgi:pimeloyl-ACP methyl ester carboxylesterase
VALVTYFAYVGYEGSRQLTDAPAPSANCRTPSVFGWTYEAVNYDIATDEALAAELDQGTCSRQGAPPGDAVQAADGVSLAGWYIPAGNGSGPTDPTVVIVHGWGSNKSDMLDRAAILHDRYNLLLVDLRNHGQSGEAATTQGVREARDLRAMIDWLEGSKGPQSIAVLGVSMGGATAVAEADRDARVDALIIESTHATLANAAQARLEVAGYPLAMPGSWAILLGSLMRTGEDVSSADPVQGVERLDDRPLLLIHGAGDAAAGPTAADDLYAAATEAGSPTELQVCPAGGHGDSDKACPEEYPGWVLGFLERVLAPAT